MEITLTKSGNEPWTEVVKGDQRGIYRTDGKDLFVFDEIINSNVVRIKNGEVYILSQQHQARIMFHKHLLNPLW